MEHSGAVQIELLNGLRERRVRTRIQWEALLRASPVVTPLGHPDSLVHLIDWSLDEIFAALANPLPSEPGNGNAAPRVSVCACGRNPFIAYFDAGRQAMQEALVLSQAAIAPLDPRHRDSSLREVGFVLNSIARREIEAFCGICQFRLAETPVTEVREAVLCPG